jgi:hypothetical protein
VTKYESARFAYHYAPRGHSKEAVTRYLTQMLNNAERFCECEEVYTMAKCHCLFDFNLIAHNAVKKAATFAKTYSDWLFVCLAAPTGTPLCEKAFEKAEEKVKDEYELKHLLFFYKRKIKSNE